MSWWDEGWGTLQQIGSDIYGGFQQAVVDPFQQAAGELRTDIYGALQNDPYSWDRGAGVLSAIGKQAYELPTDIINKTFGQAMRPVEIASDYYSKQALAADNPQNQALQREALIGEVEPGFIENVGGGSLRDIAESKSPVQIPISTPLGEIGQITSPISGIENPYVLQTIESAGGELLGELADPTNIPGALVGAAGSLGRAATNVDKLLAGMGVISGFSGGIPQLASGLGDITEEGLTPESYGKLLEGAIGTGFGALSAQGLKGGPIAAGSPNPFLATPESTLGPEAGVFQFGPENESFQKAQDKVTEDMINKMQTETIPSEQLYDVTGTAFEEGPIPYRQDDTLQMNAFFETLMPEVKEALIPAEALPDLIEPEVINNEFTASHLGITPYPENIEAFEALEAAALEQKEVNDRASAIDVIPIDPIQQAFNESQANALQAKIEQLQSQGFGEETIGGLTPDQANALISAQTPRSEFREESYEDKVQTAMRQNSMSREFAEELLASEGILPDLEPNIVFHGSPYDFEQFDLSKIGTGEGAQAYGHGFYFAENPEVAADYARNISGMSSPAQIAYNIVEKNFFGDKKKALDYVEYQNKINSTKIPDEVVKHIKEGTYTAKPSSQIYSASIPHPDEFIDLDKPLGEQSEKVKAAIPDIIQKAERYEPNLIKAVHDIEAAIPYLEDKVDKETDDGDTVNTLKASIKQYYETGELPIQALEVSLHGINYYRKPQEPKIKEVDALLENLRNADTSIRLQDAPGQYAFPIQGKESRLKEQGLKGIRYFDRQSRKPKSVEDYIAGGLSREMAEQIARDDKKQTRNYVVFDPKDIKILEKTKEIDREKLAAFVANVKQKYGQRSWRNKMTPKEQNTFNDLQVEATKPIAKQQEVIDVEARAPAGEKVSPSDRTWVENSDTNSLRGILSTLENAPNKNEPGIQTSINAIKMELNKRNIQPVQSQQLTPPPSLPPITQPPSSNLPPIQPSKKLSMEELVKQIQNQPPSPPTESNIPPEPPTPEEKPIRYQDVSRLRRALQPVISVIRKASPESAAKVEAFMDYHETNASRAIGKSRRLRRYLSKAEQAMIPDLMEGKPVPNATPMAKAAAKEYREIEDKIAKLAEENKVFIGYREGHFPRKYKEGFEYDISPSLFDPKDKKQGNLERARVQEKRTDYRRDLGVLEEYFDEAYKRIAEAKFLGKNLNEVISRKFKGNPEIVNYIENNLMKLTGRKHYGPLAKVAGEARRGAAIIDLPLVALYQPSQAVVTASEAGIWRSLKAAAQVATSPKTEWIEAIRTGASWPGVANEMTEAIGKKGFIWGGGKTDQLLRVHANVVGRYLVNDAKRGNKGALADLRRLGTFDLNDPEIHARVGKALADKTNLRSGILDLPGWSTEPAGKLATQYSAFAYQYTRYLGNLFKQVYKSGDYRPLARHLTMMAPLMGEVIADSREIIKSLVPGGDEDDEVLNRIYESIKGDEKFDSKKLLDKLISVTRSKRIPITSPFFRFMQNLTMVGGIGIFQNILERIISNRPLEGLVGPVLTKGARIAEAAGKGFGKGFTKEDWRFRELQKEGLRNLPVPWRYKIAEELIPSEKRKSSGFLPDLDPIGNVLPNF